MRRPGEQESLPPCLPVALSPVGPDFGDWAFGALALGKRLGPR